jgi:hypothetical protein
VEPLLGNQDKNKAEVVLSPQRTKWSKHEGVVIGRKHVFFLTGITCEFFLVSPGRSGTTRLVSPQFSNQNSTCRTTKKSITF